MRVWDQRRLVYPTAWFTENSFQNWTRRESPLLGKVLLVLDHRADVAALREAAVAIIANSEHWDGRSPTARWSTPTWTAFMSGS